MGLDDIGHSRVLYGSLRELGTPDAGMAEDSYGNVPFLDQPWTDWTQFVAANAVLDTAFSLMLETLASGNVELLRSRLRKMLHEERYHYLHGRSWMREARITAAVKTAWGEAVEWFGPEGGDVDQARKAGEMTLGVGELRARLEDRLASKQPRFEIDWKKWDPERRRTRSGGIDGRTLEMLQGLAEKRYMPA
jgi:1,2-phenylacetyl-CoA epoxidase catalytic subunit